MDAGRALRLPPVRNRLAERILPEADVQRMIALEKNTRNRMILTLLYASGIRVSELCALYWRDTRPNTEAGQITVFGKGGVTRAVHLPVTVWKQLTHLRGRRARTTRSFDPARRVVLYNRLLCCELSGGRAKRAGTMRSYPPHWLRMRMHLTRLTSHPPLIWSRRFGHASITTTGRYLHARPEEGWSRSLAV